MPNRRDKVTPERGQTKAATPVRSKWLWLHVSTLVVAVGTLCTVAVLSGAPTDAPRSPVIPQQIASAMPALPPIHSTDALSPRTLAELLALPSEQLDRVDIGLVNLLCSEDLPGSEDLDIAGVLATLDQWAGAVALETARHYARFVESPAEYESSEPYFRMLVLLTVLQRDLGVHYNMSRANNPDFGNPKDQFIHGMVGDDNGGTCVSMPVLYVAIGRRLGYPLKLALAHEHVYCRWDDGKGTVKNFDGASRGLHSFSDEYYRQWPRPITDEDLGHRELLVSLTPTEELSVFLAARGHCLAAHQRFSEARECYAQAVRLFPSSKANQSFIEQIDLALHPPIRVQPGAPQSSSRNFGMPDLSDSSKRGP